MLFKQANSCRQNATLWSEAVAVRGGAVRLGHHPAVPHGHLLLHPERRPDRGHSSGRGV